MSYAPFRSEPSCPADSFKSSSPISSRETSLEPARLRSRRTRRNGSPRSRSALGYPIIVHCHLCWDWVWQRPQQFLSRLSRRHPVLFVEMLAPDPSLAAPLARFRIPDGFPNLTVLTMQFPAWRWDNAAWVDAQRRRLLQEFLAGPGGGRFDNPVQWFYDPMAVRAFAGHLREVLTVYDCMDELSKFAAAPPELIEREQELLARADVVFTGGRRLFEAKSRLNPNCYFHGCGVEWEHFGKAQDPATPLPAPVARLPKPVLGYIGVIDERVDYALLDDLAQENPGWSIVMVGPTMKIDERNLPRGANLHWVGKQAYADLPAFAKAFDVCLMPFALNEATEFINPTKALEYMATGRPIVSTPVADVVRNFGEVVQIGASPAEFIQLCRAAVERPDLDALNRGLRLVAENSWDAIVARLENHVQEALAAKALVS